MQDFSQKMSICIRKDLPEWQVLNAAAHIAAYFGNKLKQQFATGDYFVTKDGLHIPRNSQYGIVILRANSEDLSKVLKGAADQQVDWMGFTREMVDFLDDNELQGVLSQKGSDEVDYLAMGVFGPREKLQLITKGLQLWK